MLAGIILAAGASSRMGRPKALLPCVDGRSFLASLAATLTAAGVDPIVVVVAAPHAAAVAPAAEALGLEVVVNPVPERGQLSSLVLGLDALDDRGVEGVMVTPVDQPLVSPDTVRRLAGAWRASSPLVVRPEHDGRHGHPVVFDARLFPELRGADPGAGARATIARHEADVLDVPVSDPGAFEDIDTPGDYRRLVGLPL